MVRLSVLLLACLPHAVFAGEITVARRMVDDYKAVVATVEPGRLLTARARIGGIVEQLKIKEGQTVVTAGQIKLRNGTAVVVDNAVQPSASAAPVLPQR